MKPRFRSTLLYILILLALLFAGIIWIYHLHRHIQDKPLRVDSAGYLVNIVPGTSAQKIAETLARDGVMDHPLWFVLWVKFSEHHGKLKAGEYMIKPGMTPEGFIKLMAAGKVYQHPMTIVEGWTFEQLMDMIHKQSILEHTLANLTQAEIMSRLGVPNEHPEGRFFPETYHFPRGTTDIAFLRRAFRMMDSRLFQAWRDRDPNLPLKSPYDVLILASIIERESNFPEEYPEIAGVFLRRIARNMPLQADPTVIYGAGKRYNGQITQELLRTPSPYNTYMILGLPPTPISMPSHRALYAATHPKEGDTLYFVAKSDGKGHIFSRTLDEHNKAVTQYRKTLMRTTNNAGN